MTDRRSFLASLAAAPVAVRTGLTPPVPVSSGETFPATAGSSAPEGPWDFSWIDKLNGTYRQVFDCGEASDDPLRVVRGRQIGLKRNRSPTECPNRGCSLLGFSPGLAVDERDVGPASSQLCRDDGADPLSAGNQRHTLDQIHGRSVYADRAVGPTRGGTRKHFRRP